MGRDGSRSPSSGSLHKFNARKASKSPGQGAVFKMDFSKPPSASEEFTPTIYKNKDPIGVSCKMRVEEGGSVLGRVQSKEANPEFFFALKLSGPGIQIRSPTPLATKMKSGMKIDLARRMRESSAMRR